MEMSLEHIVEEVKFYIINHNYEEAKRLLESALKKFPENEELLYHLGILYELMFNEEEAVRIYRKILELYPSGKRARDVVERLKKLGEI
jgi:tetratricopeptide (TPR) repeat protein